MLHELTGTAVGCRARPSAADHRADPPASGRRRAVLVLVAALAGASAPAAGAEAAVAPLAVREIAAGVYVHSGAQQEMSAGNRGDVANVGFVVGTRCVAVIDTGGSIAVGRALRAAMRAVTAAPVCYVINTHVHPDHVFGNAAFRDERPSFVGHARLAAALAARGPNYRRALLRELGEVAAGSEVIVPDLEVGDRLDLDLGGRILELTAWPTAHTDNDLTVHDPQTGTLWLSDLLFVERVPVVDGSLRGWLAVMDELRRLSPRRVVPGHGAVAGQWPQALEPQQRYLATLATEIRQALAQRSTIQQALATVGQHERAHWLLFDSFHRRNVAAVYAELEWEE